MVDARWDQQELTGQILIRPNCSLSWSSTLAFFGVISLVSLSVALFLALMGAWPVLPFAGLELLALGSCLYYGACKAHCYEHISIDDREIVIARGRRREHERYGFQRYWARVELQRPRRGWYSNRLRITSHGRAVEIGRYLTDEEREQLAESLRGMLNQTAMQPV